MFAGLENIGKSLQIMGNIAWDSTKNVFNFVTGNWGDIKNKPLSDYTKPPTPSKPTGGGKSITDQFNALPSQQKTGIFIGGALLLVLLLRR